MSLSRRSLLKASALAAIQLPLQKSFGLFAVPASTSGVTFDARSLIVHGRRTLMICGEMHYSRSTRDLWPALLDRSVAMGLNCISTYVFWNIHEPTPSEFHFTGDADLRHFLTLCAQRKLNVFLRVGPYCCAEWNFGGFPFWLRDIPGITFRTMNPAYTARVESYFTRLAQETAPFLASNGGPVILVQVENEYSNISKRYGEEGQAYLRWMTELAQRVGFGKVPISNCEGGAPGAIETANGDVISPEHVREMLAKHPASPALWSELYPSWYQLWGKPAPKPRTPESMAFAILDFLAAGGSGWNYYMWHGGTNFARTSMYLQITSYDFHAPLDEYGRPSALGLYFERMHHVLLDHQRFFLEGTRTQSPLPSGLVQTRWLLNGETLTFLSNPTKQTITIQLADRVLFTTSAPAPQDTTLPPWRTVVSNLQWQSAPEPLPSSDRQQVHAEEPIEQLSLTKDTTDYCWYSTTINLSASHASELVIPYGGDLFTLYVDEKLHARNQGALYENRGPIVPHTDRYPFIVANHHDNEHDDGYRFRFSLANLPAGEHRVDLLAASIGLIKGDWQIGYPMNMERKGIWEGVLLDGHPIHGWTMTPGLLGETTPPTFSAPTPSPIAAETGLTWYRTEFSLTPADLTADADWHLDAQDLGKGILTLNGHDLGRHWLLAAGDSTTPSQRFYHVPRSFLAAHNTLTIFDEQGATPHAVTLERRDQLRTAKRKSTTLAALLLATLALCGGTSRAQTQPLIQPSTERRIDALLQQMTLDGKLGQLVQYNLRRPLQRPDTPITGPELATTDDDSLALAATGRLGSMLNVTGATTTNELQHAAVDRSRLHIPLLFGSDVIHGYRTIYPIPLALAATFDPELVTALTHMAAEEASSAGIRWVYSPMVDLTRDPRWGRVMEGSGEDTFLGSAMARASVLGYQGTALSTPGSVAACAKHFAAYGAPEAGREYAAADLSLLRLRQDYLPPYRAAVDAGVASIMASFNTVNGVPATTNHFLLTEVLRHEWGFQGAVVTDFGAIPELKNHGVAETDADAARMALHAGVDVEMISQTFQRELPTLVHNGIVPIADIDRAVRNILRLKFALGLFDAPYIDPTREVTAALPTNRPLARKAAEESLVLLRNEPVNGSPLLPLPTGKTIALLGSAANDPDLMLGAWSIAGKPSDVVTLRSALEQRHAKLLTSTSPTDAVTLARQADIVLLTLSEPRTAQGEATSRTSLDLPTDQLALLQSLVATGKPIVAVVFSSRPLILAPLAETVPAILEAWAPGVEAGPALANILFGDSAPSGHLPMSFPRNVGQEPLYYAQLPTGRPAGDADLTHPPTQSTKYLSRYIDSPNSPLYPFGFGLTYTTFSYSSAEPSQSTVDLHGHTPTDSSVAVIVRARITNTGHRTATAVPQLYMRNTGTSVSQPLRLLRGFQRITLAPSESRMLSFPLRWQDLAFYDANANPTLEPSTYTFWIGNDGNDSTASTTRLVTYARR